MASRTLKRLIYIALVMFLLTGLFIVDKRPHRKQEHSKLLSSFQDMMLLELLAYLPHEKAGEASLKANAQMVEDPKKDTENDNEVELDACTALNPSRGFIDLRGLSSHAQEGKFQTWLAKDYELGRNFSVGICLSPVKKSVLSTGEFKDAVNASEVGAYYMDPESQKYVLMGQFSGKPVFKGKKLTMTYENGSFCDSIVAMDGLRIRRSTILTFTCDREMLNKAQVSYIASAQECTFLFEVRSHFACPTAAKADNLAAIWIFLLILMAALLVFFSGSLIIKSLRFFHTKHTPTLGK